MARIPLLFMAFILFANRVSAQQKETKSGDVVFSPGDCKTRFTWQSDLQGNHRNPHAALLVPVKLPGSPRTYYMQLDTGSPVSVLYRHSFGAVRPGDSINVEIRLGGRTIILKKPAFFEKTGSETSTDTVIIGTLGTDLLASKIVQIDYPRQTLTFADKLPASLENRIPWSPLFNPYGKILLPSVIRSREKFLCFDSGSSSFELLTDAESWSLLACRDSVARSYPVQSWNKTLTAHTVASADSIQLAGYKLPLRYVSYMEGVDERTARQMKALGMGGMTGNTLFLRSVLILDLRNKRYGLLPGRRGKR